MCNSGGRRGRSPLQHWGFGGEAPKKNILGNTTVLPKSYRTVVYCFVTCPPYVPVQNSRTWPKRHFPPGKEPHPGHAKPCVPNLGLPCQEVQVLPWAITYSHASCACCEGQCSFWPCLGIEGQMARFHPNPHHPVCMFPPIPLDHPMLMVR